MRVDSNLEVDCETEQWSLWILKSLFKKKRESKTSEFLSVLKSQQSQIVNNYMSLKTNKGMYIAIKLCPATYINACVHIYTHNTHTLMQGFEKYNILLYST